MSRKNASQPEYGTELKLAVRRVLAGESARGVAQELDIRRKRLYVWKDRYTELGEAGLTHRRAGRPRKVGASTGAGNLYARVWGVSPWEVLPGAGSPSIRVFGWLYLPSSPGYRIPRRISLRGITGARRSSSKKSEMNVLMARCWSRSNTSLLQIYTQNS